MTAWSNDIGYEDVFAREVEALGRAGDVLLGLSTSGRSPNLVRAFERARQTGLRTIALLGGDGGDLQPLADHVVLVPSRNTQHIQEAHDVVVHVLCELVEQRLVAAGWFAQSRGGEASGSSAFPRGSSDAAGSARTPTRPSGVTPASAATTSDGPRPATVRRSPVAGKARVQS